MSSEPAKVLTGGCQCGNLRFRIDGPLTGSSICHCRMCQKATGGFFGAYAGAKLEHFAWTKGEPAAFNSSEAVERHFCRDCGTPMSYRYLGSKSISLSIGAYDDPDAVPPTAQFSRETRLACFDALASLPEDELTKYLPLGEPRFRSRQHPDKD